MTTHPLGTLVIWRKAGEEILIGDDVRIVVDRVRGGGRCRLVVRAPKGLAVRRGEQLDEPEPARRYDGGR